MSASARKRLVLAALLLINGLIASIVLILPAAVVGKNTAVAYFSNSNGIFAGDEVRIRGVAVGTISEIEPEPDRAKITFTYNKKYKVPANADAVILSPSLVTARAIQLTPVYKGGPQLADHAVIPLDRTAVPVEFDDLRQQLQRLTDTLQPTRPGGVSTLGSLVNTAADNLRGNGASIRDTVIKLSAAFSALGDHSSDLFSTIKNLSILVSALQSSTDLMRQLNRNLADVTGALANGPDELGKAINDLDDVVGDVQSFVADNRDALGTTTDKLGSITTALNQSLDDITQLLHVAPTAFQNFINIYQPAQGTTSGALAINNFANPITFLCGAIEAASRLGAKQSAKLCAQYLAPIFKNRQYNYLPLGLNIPVGASARPNELTYSQDWLRPDYLPPHAPAPNPGPPGVGMPPTSPDAAAPGPPTPKATNPADGLTGMMTPSGDGP